MHLPINSILADYHSYKSPVQVVGNAWQPQLLRLILTMVGATGKNQQGNVQFYLNAPRKVMKMGGYVPATIPTSTTQRNARRRCLMDLKVPPELIIWILCLSKFFRRRFKSFLS